MGSISLQIPQLGLPDSSEDPKVASNFGVLQTLLNGSIDDSNLAHPNNGVRRLLTAASGMLIGLNTAGDYALTDQGTLVPSSAQGTAGFPIWLGDSGISGQPKDFQVAGLAAYGRIRACIATNSQAPLTGFTIGLYAVTGSFGTVNNVGIQFAGAITGATVNVPAPAASTLTVAESAQFPLPLGVNVLGVNLNGNSASNSATLFCCQLYGYNA